MKRTLTVFLSSLLLIAMAAGCARNAGETAAPANGTESAAAAGAAQSGSGQPVEIRISTVQLPTQQMGIGLATLAENITKNLGDKVNVKAYDSAQLYAASEEIEAAARGEIHLFFAIGGSMETISEKIQMVKLPFLFPSTDVAYQVLEEGEAGKQIFQPVNDIGLNVYGLFSAGSAAVANNQHPLLTPADFAGLKMRAPGKMDSLSMTTLGANAVVTPSEETYSAIQQGVIDGMTTPNTVFIPRRYHEVQKYVTNTSNMSMQIGYLVGNTAWMDSLPEDIRTGVMSAIDETISGMKAEIEVADAALYEEMRELGCEVHDITDEEKAQWAETLSAVYTEMETELGKDLVDLARKEVEEYSK